jgi:hypothetical protein
MPTAWACPNEAPFARVPETRPIRSDLQVEGCDAATSLHRMISSKVVKPGLF